MCCPASSVISNSTERPVHTNGTSQMAGSIRLVAYTYPFLWHRRPQGGSRFVRCSEGNVLTHIRARLPKPREALCHRPIDRRKGNTTTSSAEPLPLYFALRELDRLLRVPLWYVPAPVG